MLYCQKLSHDAQLFTQKLPEITNKLGIMVGNYALRETIVLPYMFHEKVCEPFSIEIFICSNLVLLLAELVYYIAYDIIAIDFWYASH